MGEGSSTDFAGFESYVGRVETIQRLESCGDVLLREVPEPSDGAIDDESPLIRARAEQIAKRHPELREELLAYAENQVAEVLFPREHFAGTLWALRRSVDAGK